jgi:hypothetical protein
MAEMGRGMGGNGGGAGGVECVTFGKIGEISATKSESYRSLGSAVRSPK